VNFPFLQSVEDDDWQGDTVIDQEVYEEQWFEQT
jgi:hypothetical protein